MDIRPTIEHRAPLRYVGVRHHVSGRAFGELNARVPELFAFLAGQGTGPEGPPFYRFEVVGDGRHVVQAGVPVAADVPTESDLFLGTLPEGRYATVLHRGHPDALFDVNAALLEWAGRKGLRLDRTTAADGEHWGCRLEVFRTDPQVQPDPAQWETEVAIRLSGG
ncbi:GyrI-like domain-containing protein [Qaidamihabitans albus]|uniref:GyrI-like domain-containing protein n=1 Tax=Qaidamihabitans albus TaxID=2795733 RepID=UPI0018F129E0|nr:GyrI-like domain-containing protein [Qaidamihabitans albus]